MGCAFAVCFVCWRLRFDTPVRRASGELEALALEDDEAELLGDAEFDALALGDIEGLGLVEGLVLVEGLALGDGEELVELLGLGDAL